MGPYTITILEQDYREWSRWSATRQRKTPFAELFATRRLKGWSFSGISLEDYEASFSELVEVANKWLAQRQAHVSES